MGEVSAVVESELAPAICRVLCRAGVRLERVGQGIESIIVTSGTVGNIPWGTGIVQAIRVSIEDPDWCISLV